MSQDKREREEHKKAKKNEKKANPCQGYCCRPPNHAPNRFLYMMFLIHQNSNRASDVTKVQYHQARGQVARVECRAAARPIKAESDTLSTSELRSIFAVPAIREEDFFFPKQKRPEWGISVEPPFQADKEVSSPIDAVDNEYHSLRARPEEQAGRSNVATVIMRKTKAEGEESPCVVTFVMCGAGPVPFLSSCCWSQVGPSFVGCRIERTRSFAPRISRKYLSNNSKDKPNNFLPNLHVPYPVSQHR